MRKFVQVLFASLSIVMLFVGTAAAAAPSFCDDVAVKPAICGEIGAPSPDNPVVKAIASTTNMISLVIGFASVIMILIGGIRYIISNGDQARVKSAKDTVLYAAIGIVVAASAQLIVVFILNKL